MARPFIYLRVAVSTVVTVYAVAIALVNARADDRVAVAHAPGELMELVQWHSAMHPGITVAGDSCVSPEWKSTVSAIGPEYSMDFRVFRGAEGIREVAEDGFDYSPDPFDGPRGARKSARGSARAQDSSTPTAR